MHDVRLLAPDAGNHRGAYRRRRQCHRAWKPEDVDTVDALAFAAQAVVRDDHFQIDGLAQLRAQVPQVRLDTTADRRKVLSDLQYAEPAALRCSVRGHHSNPTTLSTCELN